MSVVSFRALASLTIGLALLSTDARAATVTGIVVDTAGKPIAGARVAYVPLELRSLLFGGDIAPQSVTSGPDGRWSFQSDDANTSPLLTRNFDGRVCWARVLAPGYAIAEPALKPGENRVVLQPARTLTGVVMNDKGHPVGGVNVDFAGEMSQSSLLPMQSPPELPSISARTGDDGTFSLSGLPAQGTPLLVIDDPFYQSGPVEVSNPDVPVTLLAKPGLTISGRLLKPDGTPFQGAAVFVMSSQPDRPQSTQFALSGMDGSFVITGLSNRTGVLMAFPPKDSPIVFPMHPFSTLLPDAPNPQPDWTADAGVVVSGTVLKQKDKQPLSGADVVLGGGNFEFGSTDAAGHFQLRTEPGQNFLLIQGAGDSLGIQRPVQITAGTPTDLGELDVASGVYLSGVTEDEAGQPLGGIRLTLVPGPDSFMPPNTVSGPDGAFSLGPVASGRVTLAVPIGSDYELSTDAAVSTPDTQGAPANLVVKLRKGKVFTLKLRVVTSEGKAISGARVNISVPRPGVDTGGYRAEQRFATTDADGTVLLTGVRVAGAPTLSSVEYPGYDTQTLGTATLSGDTWSFSDTTLATHDKQLTGHIFTSDGHPAAGARLSTLAAIGGACLTAVAGTDGAFELDGVPDADTKLIAASGLESTIARARPGTPLELHLQAPAPLGDATRTSFLADLGRGNFWALETYGTNLGPDKMLDLALRQDGVVENDGKTDPTRAGQAFGEFLHWYAEHDPDGCAARGPALLNEYDPTHKKTDWEISVAQAVEVAGDTNARTWANAFLDDQRKARPEMDATTDYALRWFQLAGIATGLQRKDANYFVDVAFTMAEDEGDKAVLQHSGEWTGELAMGGVTVLDRLKDEWSPEARLRGLCAAVPVIARTDTQAALSLLDQATTMSKSPGIQAWDKTNATNQDLWQSGPFLISQARSSLVNALARRDPAAALPLVSGADDWVVPSLYLHIAVGALKLGLPDIATSAAQGELNAKQKQADLEAYMGPLMARVNPALAAKLQADVDASLGQMSPGTDAEGVAAYYFYKAQEDPALARIALEVEWAAQQKAIDADPGNGDQRRSARPALAAALFPVDPVRALELLNGTTDVWSGKTQARARIIAMMVTDPATWKSLQPSGWNY